MAKWVHVIGICGVATAGIAVMLKKLGWRVTGSDKGFFPPVSDYLRAHDIDILPGFKPERLDENGILPDLIVIQGTKGEANPELKAAREMGLKIKLYPEILKEYVVVPDGSVVVAGSFGKSTTTAVLVSIFKQAGISCSYMYGALTPDLTATVEPKNDTTEFSIIEGDEYVTSCTDTSSKFSYYSPKFLVLTGLAWDHPDVFPTEALYYESFNKLLSQLPKDGIIVANGDDLKIREVLNKVTNKIIYFSTQQRNPGQYAQWYYLDDSKPLPVFVKHENNQQDVEIIPFTKQIVGKFNIQNLLAAAVMAYHLGVKKEAIQAGIKTFSGLKRRLEVRFQKENSLVIDDFGSAPAKAISSLTALREEYPQHRIVAVFEPTAGNRDPKALTQFQETFKNADLVILPKFSVLPKTSQFLRFDEKVLSQKLTEFKVANKVILNDPVLVNYLKHEFTSRPEVIIVFLGSHSFRGMITSLTTSLAA